MAINFSSLATAGGSGSAASSATANNTVGTIYLNLQVNQNNLAGQINQASNSTAQAISTNANSIFGRFLSLAAITAAVSTLEKLGEKAIEVASNMTEVQNVVDTAFDDMAYKAEQFADIAIEQFGISELSAKKTSSTFMAMAKGMGIASEAASDMSINVAKMSADVASFYNLDYETASDKLKAIFTGETESLKSLGIVMTETNLKNYAMSQGITQNIKDMSQADQTILRYKYVMSQLSLAQGDFAKTSDSWSNSTKVLSESWTSFLGKIGTGLIKYLTPFLHVVEDIVKNLNEWADTMAEKFGWQEVEDNATETMDAVSSAIVDTTDEAVKEANAKMLGLLGMDEIQKLDDTKGESIIESMFNTDDLNIYDNVSKELDKTETKTDKFFDKIKDSFSNFKDSDFVSYIKQGFGTIGDIFSQLIEDIGGTDTVLSALKDTFKTAADTIGGFFSGLAEVFAGLLESILGIIQADPTKIKEGVDKMLGGVTTIFEPVTSNLTEAASAMGVDTSNWTNEGMTVNMLKNGWNVMKSTNPFTALLPSAKFADGGIVGAPTLGLVGEYSNARNNPEVISPLSDLKDILVDAFREAIGNNNSDDSQQINLTVNLGSKTIVNELATEINRQTKRRNKEVIITT